MIVRDLAARFGALLLVAALLATAGCHRTGDFEPMTEQKIYVSDRYFDVYIKGPKEALIIGYGGKVLHTTDGGLSFSIIETPTNKALYSIDFAEGDQVGWMVGEEGTILKTTDGGMSWTPQKTDIWLDPECSEGEYRESRVLQQRPCVFAYLFSIDVLDENTAHIIGDKSIHSKTTDGGKTWNTVTIAVPNENISADMLLAFEDPVLYDVAFIDHDRGFIVGEFGKIFYTDDAGVSWAEQQESVMDASVMDVLDLPTFFDIEFLDDNTGIVAGLDGRIAMTTDGGKDWNFLANNVDDFVDPFYSATILPNGTRWVVGASGQVVSAKKGDEFARGQLGTSVNNWMRRIRFLDNDTGWIVGGFGFVMSTSDGGETWFRRFG